MPTIAVEDSKRLSGRDSLRVLKLLENPPAPNKKLLAALGHCPSGGQRREGMA